MHGIRPAADLTQAAPQGCWWQRLLEAGDGADYVKLWAELDADDGYAKFLDEMDTAEAVDITELEPDDEVHIGKSIRRDGSISDYPKVTWWWQSVSTIRAKIDCLYAYLWRARRRNICLIRGTCASPDCLRTRRWKAYEQDRGDHGFIDTPTRLLPLDIDGVPIRWREDPERAIRTIVAQLGEPWASTSFVWFYSSTHGLERDDQKRWTGRIIDGVVKVHLFFLTDRPLGDDEAGALVKLAKTKLPQVDPSSARRVQPNYIRRPLWRERPESDPLGDISTIGMVRAANEYLKVPDNLEHEARWAKAQGHGVDIAPHPDAESAVRAVGSNASIRSHLMSATRHLLRANPCPEPTSFDDHAADIVSELGELVEQHRDEIETNLAQHRRHWSEVLGYLPDNMVDWARWLLDRPAALHGKTITLLKQAASPPPPPPAADEIYARVAETVERVCFGPRGAEPPAELLIAPTGSRKSTLMRAAAVRYVEEHPRRSVVICVPLHKLGEEQVRDLRREHPNGKFTAAIWRGRGAPDPADPEQQMCRRYEDTKLVEDALLDVRHGCCKQRRGRKVIKCPLYDGCAYQAQNEVEARIWFCAHELLVQEPLKVFGDVGLLLIDECPLDAFTFGLERQHKVTLALDLLQERGSDNCLNEGRAALYAALDRLQVPSDPHLGTPATRACLREFIARPFKIFGREIYMPEHDARHCTTVEWQGKVQADVRPDMSSGEIVRAIELAAAVNPKVKQRATLFNLVGDFVEADRFRRSGCIQVHRGPDGREIRMVGLRPLAEGWRQMRTLITDATGDPVLLRMVWPQLRCDQSDWQQLPRGPNVRVRQIVDRTFSKTMIAIEGNEKALKVRRDAAVRAYAAALMQALEYGGQPVAVITYKTMRAWLEENCFVPPWLTLLHHGAVAGTNEVRSVRAEFVIGRMLPPAEVIVRQAEALTGRYIARRDYEKGEGEIPIVPDAAGNTAIAVEVWRHPHPVVDRLRRQPCEGGLLQAAGRARAGLRQESEALDLHIYTDVPLPELGRVEPVLWDEVAVGLDALMLAAGGVWLECGRDAVEAYPGVFKLEALKQDRKRRGVSTFPIGSPYRDCTHTSVLKVTYQRVGKGRRTARAVTLLAPDQVRGWLEARLGALVLCEVEG